MYFLEEGKAPFLEYLRNITPQVFLLTIAVFCHETSELTTIDGWLNVLLKILGVVSGSLAIYAAWASSLRYLEQHEEAVEKQKTRLRDIGLEPEPTWLVSGGILFVVNLVVLAAYLTAAMNVPMLVAAAKT